MFWCVFQCYVWGRCCFIVKWSNVMSVGTMLWGVASRVTCGTDWHLQVYTQAASTFTRNAWLNSAVILKTVKKIQSVPMRSPQMRVTVIWQTCLDCSKNDRPCGKLALIYRSGAPGPKLGRTKPIIIMCSYKLVSVHQRSEPCLCVLFWYHSAPCCVVPFPPLHMRACVGAPGMCHSCVKALMKTLDFTQTLNPQLWRHSQHEFWGCWHYCSHIPDFGVAFSRFYGVKMIYNSWNVLLWILKHYGLKFRHLSFKSNFLKNCWFGFRHLTFCL